MDLPTSIKCAGELVAYIRECVQEHNATPTTEIFVRDGANGPMRQIAQVRMGTDQRGTYIVLETSAVIVN